MHQSILKIVHILLLLTFISDSYTMENGEGESTIRGNEYTQTPSKKQRKRRKRKNKKNSSEIVVTNQNNTALPFSSGTTLKGDGPLSSEAERPFLLSSAEVKKPLPHQSNIPTDLVVLPTPNISTTPPLSFKSLAATHTEISAQSTLPADFLSDSVQMGNNISSLLSADETSQQKKIALTNSGPSLLSYILGGWWTYDALLNELNTKTFDPNYASNKYRIEKIINSLIYNNDTSKLLNILTQLNTVSYPITNIDILKKITEQAKTNKLNSLNQSQHIFSQQLASNISAINHQMNLVKEQLAQLQKTYLKESDLLNNTINQNYLQINNHKALIALCRQNNPDIKQFITPEEGYGSDAEENSPSYSKETFLQRTNWLDPYQNITMQSTRLSNKLNKLRDHIDILQLQNPTNINS